MYGITDLTNARQVAEEQERQQIEKREAECKRQELMNTIKEQNLLLRQQIDNTNKRSEDTEKSAKKSNKIAIISAIIAGCSFVVAIASFVVMLVK